MTTNTNNQANTLYAEHDHSYLTLNEFQYQQYSNIGVNIKLVLGPGKC